MTGWGRKLVLLLMLAVMPLQGMAATLAALYCGGDAHPHAAHMAGHANHDGGHEQHGDDGGSGSGANDHLCCNVSVPAPATVVTVAMSGDSPIRATIPDPFHHLFIPDRPQRPPLA